MIAWVTVRTWGEMVKFSHTVFAMPFALLAAMLAGRSRFFAKWQQTVALFEAYRRFYVDSCDCTLAAVAQVYPAGLQWLEEPGPAAERKDRRE